MGIKADERIKAIKDSLTKKPKEVKKVKEEDK